MTTSSTQSWTYSGDRLPADPGHAQFRFNAWISDKSLYNPDTNVDIAIESFAFTPLQPLPTPPTKVWIGGYKNSGGRSLWSNPLNWQTISDPRPDGYGRKLIFGTQNVVDHWPVADLAYNEPVGEMEFDGYFPVSGIDGDRITMDNGNDVGQKHDALITVKNGPATQSIQIEPTRVVLNNNLRITIEDSTDELTFGGYGGGMISGTGALFLIRRIKEPSSWLPTLIMASTPTRVGRSLKVASSKSWMAGFRPTAT